MTCPKCKAQLPAGAISCSKCGTRFKTKTCPHCGQVILANLSQCPRCGKKLTKSASSKANEKKPLTKRWWFWSLSILLVLGIIGNIGNAMKGGKTGTSTRSPSATASPEAVEDNAFLTAKIQEADVMNGTKTSKIGTWAYIEMKKADAKAASSEDYAEFAKQIVGGKDYNWFSVLFEDGTGIQFTGCHTYLATYGQLDKEGCVTQPEGDITSNTKTGYCSYDLRKASSTPEPTVSPTEAPASAPTTAPTEEPPSQPETNSPSSSANTSTNDNTSNSSSSTVQDKPSGNSGGNAGGANNFNTYDNPEQQQTSANYVLNTNTMKFHYPSCKDVRKIAPDNYAEFNGTRNEVVAKGYSSCGHCKP